MFVLKDKISGCYFRGKSYTVTLTPDICYARVFSRESFANAAKVTAIYKKNLKNASKRYKIEYPQLLNDEYMFKRNTVEYVKVELEAVEINIKETNYDR